VVIIRTEISPANWNWRAKFSSFASR